MKIVHAHPPNITEIEAVFPGVSKTDSILYTFGDAIYTLSKSEIPPWIIEHEKVHSQRQYELGGSYQGGWLPDDFGKKEQYEYGAQEWWNRYIQDPEFRLEEELLAHRIELEVFSRYYTDRNTRRMYLKSIAKRLSSGMYGRMVTFEKARKLIKEV